MDMCMDMCMDVYGCVWTCVDVYGHVYGHVEELGAGQQNLVDSCTNRDACVLAMCAHMCINTFAGMC